jgi:Fe-S cluster assembly iron-binding protein IscA
LESKRDNQVKEKLTDKDKKKKVDYKKDTVNRGLKFSNPSKRNRSSTYE